MQIDTTTLIPWSDIHRIVTTMKTLTVRVGRMEHTGAAELTTDEHGNATLAFPAARTVKTPKVQPKKAKH